MATYLIRHTTPKIAQGICYGQANLDLVDSFLDEFQKIQSQLPVNIFTIICSPLQRCRQLASYLKKNKHIIIDERLMELHFGRWELCLWDKISKDEPWFQDYITVAPPGGESYLELSERVIEFYEEQIKGSRKNKIIITHAGTIRAILAHHKKITLEESLNIPIAFGEIIELG